MGEINEKILTEFFELMKRVGEIEKNQNTLIANHNTVLEKCTNMIQNFQDTIQSTLSNQNRLVQQTNDEIARQANRALGDISTNAATIIRKQAEGIPSKSEIDEAMIKLRELEAVTNKIMRSIGFFTKAINQIKVFEEPTNEVKTHPELDVSIHDLDLTRRSVNCLLSENIYTLGDLIKCSRIRLLKTPNLGKRSVDEIVYALEKRGVCLSAN